MSTEPQQGELQDAPLCPRCKNNRMPRGRSICGACEAEERAEADAVAEDNRTAAEARKRDADEKRGKQEPSQGQPRQRNGGGQRAPQHQQAAPSGPPSGPPRDMPSASRPPQGGAPAPGARKMSIDAITAKPKDSVHKALLYGPEGVGKTTFGMEAPSPIFIPTETSSILEKSSTPRFPQPQTWGELLEALAVLADGQHEYKTLVLDTVDRAEELAHAEAIRLYNASSPKLIARNIEEVGGGFMKGYVAALDLLRVLISRLERLIAKRGMHVVLIGHGAVRKVKDPSLAGDFDQWDVALYAGNNASAADLFRNWADTVLFVNYETKVKVDRRGRAKSRAESPVDGSRLLYTQRTAGWRAKNRDGLPLSMPFSWANYEWAVSKSQDPEYLVEVIREKTGELGDAAIAEWVEAELAKKPAPQRLVQINLKLAARLEQAADAAARAADGELAGGAS